MQRIIQQFQPQKHDITTEVVTLYQLRPVVGFMSSIHFWVVARRLFYAVSSVCLIQRLLTCREMYPTQDHFMVATLFIMFFTFVRRLISSSSNNFLCCFEFIVHT